MKKALFLDRDGVINVEKEYLYKREDFEFIDGIFDLCKYYQNLGYLIIIVTNQSGIARGYYTEEDFQVLTDWMIQEFKKRNINITKVYHCPHHPDINIKCSCRKPEPGMILEAQKKFNLDLIHSLMIGDKQRDIEAAVNAGISETYLFDEMNQIRSSKATKTVTKLDEIWK
ncbi:D-glycero-beta-D-manno-heptose 1,7-bisphosphate 7-phosphatase [Sulfurimonas sp. SWIR-19]|uniref:D-glycero-beta-D-manno-heptose 1,7-bisphosphate 7-phosphatase n=1 Tax=Sulfurimonas sp. SWIR-19 TaxID=2878390 RepID=UPI001CF48719|nr:D-glycero-beta-D-manno-heptose 1,7-bisphosphate 7-phosphatase [Sulfurimonas sp. SWIR-19]UCN01049.1 D-glycero-beta-D-manno-heptose 1,7-bisphosphate 7-phosphatase [Sulfurimonas sp. SWIR-19]